MKKVVEGLVIVMLFMSVLLATGALLIVTQELTNPDEGGLCLMTGERSEFDRSLD